MDSKTVLLFTRYGLGQGPEELQQLLAVKYLTLLQASKMFPAKMLFYTDGVKLVCQGSPTVDILRDMEPLGVELISCKTCLDYFNLTSQVAVGITGGLPDIIEAMQKAEKVISL